MTGSSSPAAPAEVIIFADVQPRYNVSKLVQLLIFRELAADMAQSQKAGRIVTSIINPGWVATNVMREAVGCIFTTWIRVGGKLIGRTPEQGARTVIHAAYGDDETYGKYLSDCHVSEPNEYVRGAEGKKVGEQLWHDLKVKLESIHPGVTRYI